MISLDINNGGPLIKEIGIMHVKELVCHKGLTPLFVQYLSRHSVKDEKDV